MRDREKERERDRRDYGWQQPGATYRYHQSQKQPIRSVYFRTRRLKQPEVMSQQVTSALNLLWQIKTNSSEWLFGSRPACRVLEWLVRQRFWCRAAPRFLLVVLDARCIEGWCELGRGGSYGSREGGMWRGGGVLNWKQWLKIRPNEELIVDLNVLWNGM